MAQGTLHLPLLAVSGEIECSSVSHPQVYVERPPLDHHVWNVMAELEADHGEKLPSTRVLTNKDANEDLTRVLLAAAEKQITSVYNLPEFAEANIDEKNWIRSPRNGL